MKDALRAIDTVTEEILFCQVCKETRGLEITKRVYQNGAPVEQHLHCRTCGHKWMVKVATSRRSVWLVEYLAAPIARLPLLPTQREHYWIDYGQPCLTRDEAGKKLKRYKRGSTGTEYRIARYERVEVEVEEKE